MCLWILYDIISDRLCHTTFWIQQWNNVILKSHFQAFIIIQSKCFVLVFFSFWIRYPIKDSHILLNGNSCKIIINLTMQYNFSIFFFWLNCSNVVDYTTQWPKAWGYFQIREKETLKKSKCFTLALKCNLCLALKTLNQMKHETQHILFIVSSSIVHRHM